MRLEKHQGYTKQNEKFGYVHGDEGGFFFTWKPTLSATLRSIEEDEVDGDGGLAERDVKNFLAGKIAKDFAGDLCDENNDVIREATTDELIESVVASAEGWIEVDGQRCYVQEDR